MPFYTRIRLRPPLWQPMVLGAGLLFVYTTARAVFVVPALAASRPGVLALAGYIGAFALVGGCVAGVCYWALDLAPVKRSTPMRWLGGTVGVAAYLTAFALAANQFGTESPFAQLLKPGFVISTGLISVIVGGLFAKGLLTRSDTAERIYLTPAQFTALSPPDQARLRPVAEGTPDHTDSPGAV